MREYTIKGITHKIYESALEAPDEIKFFDNWREGDFANWLFC